MQVTAVNIQKLMKRNMNVFNLQQVAVTLTWLNVTCWGHILLMPV